MKLMSADKNEVKAGEVLVYRGKVTNRQGIPGQERSIYFYKLAIVVSISDKETVLSPFTALWDDDEDDTSEGAAPQKVPKSVPSSEFGTRLARPLWEVGDVLVHRGRPARVTETKANDLHVSIEYTDESGGQFYGNLIWMDSAPTLNLLSGSASWPALA